MPPLSAAGGREDDESVGDASVQQRQEEVVVVLGALGRVGASLPKDPSLSGIDVRDTKVVSCGHCAKHLIVKNGASAVKCPSCHGVSKLSTTTSELWRTCVVVVSASSSNCICGFVCACVCCAAQEMMRCKNCNTLLSLPAGARAYKCMKCLQTTRLS